MSKNLNHILLGLCGIVFLSFTLESCDNSSEQHIHTEVIDEGKPATCTESGLTDGIHCSTCGEILM